MKKKTFILASAALAAAMLGGCSKQQADSELAKFKTEKYVTLGQYTGYEASAAQTAVTDEYVDSYMQYILNSQASLEEVTGRAVQAGDTANIDFVGKQDGVAFEGGTGADYDLTIGSGAFIPGFEEGLIGANTGDTLDLELTFPEGYQNAEMAGQAVVFTVTVNQIKAYAVPELTDELASTLNPDCATVAEFRQFAEDVLNEQADRDYNNTIEDALMQQIMAACEWKQDVPEEMIQNHIDRIRSNLEQYASMSGMSFEELLYSQYGMTESDFPEQVRDGAVDSAKETLVLQAIANEQKLNPTKEELEQRLAEEAEQNGYDTVEEYKEKVGEAYYGENYRDYQMTRNVLKYIKDNSTIKTQETASEIEENDSEMEETASEIKEADMPEAAETTDPTGTEEAADTTGTEEAAAE